MVWWGMRLRFFLGWCCLCVFGSVLLWGMSLLGGTWIFVGVGVRVMVGLIVGIWV